MSYFPSNASCDVPRVARRGEGGDGEDVQSREGMEGGLPRFSDLECYDNGIMANLDNIVTSHRHQDRHPHPHRDQDQDQALLCGSQEQGGLQGRSTFQILNQLTSIIDEACNVSSLSINMTNNVDGDGDGDGDGDDVFFGNYNESHEANEQAPFLGTDNLTSGGLNSDSMIYCPTNTSSLSYLGQLLEPTPIASRGIQVVKSLSDKSGQFFPDRRSSSMDDHGLSDFIDLVLQDTNKLMKRMTARRDDTAKETASQCHHANMFRRRELNQPGTFPRGLNVAGGETHLGALPLFQEQVQTQEQQEAQLQQQQRFRQYQEEQWSERFQEMVQFRQIHGHCNVPNIYPPNTHLAQWYVRFLSFFLLQANEI